MSEFLNTISIIYKNKYINPNIATLKHICWQFRKIANRFPCEIRLKGFKVIVKNKIIANGCGGLINAMGYYDPNNMQFLEEMFNVKGCNVFFDIGANIGVYSLIAAYQSNHLKAYSFEPHPYTLTLLQENICINKLEKRIKSYCIALSDFNGQTSFSDQPGSTINRIEDVTNSSNAISVDVITGDMFCTKEKVIPDIVKIDVEGHEIRVLKGFKSSIKKIKVVMIESDYIDETTNFLHNLNGFLGPFKLNYRERTLTKNFDSNEDWVFINPSFASELQKNNFHILSN